MRPLLGKIDFESVKVGPTYQNNPKEWAFIEDRLREFEKWEERSLCFLPAPEISNDI